MTIVERLRAAYGSDVQAEAADEIERLRGLCDSLADDVERHLHEIEQLRTNEKRLYEYIYYHLQRCPPDDKDKLEDRLAKLQERKVRP